jgi:hypothetical protein
MLDLIAETPLPLAEAAKLIPPARSGKRTHLSTVLRWILRGVRLPDGHVVRLEGIRLGGRWFTSRQALQRFAERQTPKLGATPEQSVVPRSPARRQRDSARAAADLEAMGL